MFSSQSGKSIDCRPPRAQKKNARRTGRRGRRPVGWGSQGGLRSKELTPGHFEMMSPEISPTQRDVRRSLGRRAAQTEDALTVALGFLNRWSEVRVLPGPPLKSSWCAGTCCILGTSGCLARDRGKPDLGPKLGPASALPAAACERFTHSPKSRSRFSSASSSSPRQRRRRRISARSSSHQPRLLTAR